MISETAQPQQLQRGNTACAADPQAAQEPASVEDMYAKRSSDGRVHIAYCTG